jgi:hypothetical protein
LLAWFGKVAENSHALRCQSHQNIIEVVYTIGPPDAADLSCYSEHAACSMSFTTYRWFECIQQRPSFSALEQPAGQAPLGFKRKDAIEAACQAASIVVSIHEKKIPCLADLFFTY